MSEYPYLRAFQDYVGKQEDVLFVWTGLVMVVTIVSNTLRLRSVGYVLNWLEIKRIASWRVFTPQIGWVILAALLLRLPGLSESFWYDESFTYGLARLNVVDMNRVIAGDVHPPLWYYIEHVTLRLLGSSEVALRFPALVCGLALIYLVYRLASHLDKRTALVAAALVAVLPTQIYYANEARGYALLTCAVLTMVISLQENRPRLFAWAGVVTMYTHNLGFVYFGLLGLYALRSRRWVYQVFLAGMIGCLWLPSMLAQSQDVADGFWLSPLTPGLIFAPLLTMTMRRGAGDYTLIASTVILALTVSAVMFSFRPFLRRFPVWGLFTLAAPGLIALVSVVWRNVYLDRALLPSMTGLIIAWAFFLAHTRPAIRLLTIAVLIPALLFALLGHYDPLNTRLNIRQLLQRGCQGTDVAYVTTLPAGFLASYYLGSIVVWPQANDLNQSLPQSSKDALGWTVARFDELSGRICLVEAVNALNSRQERSYVASVLRRYPHYSRLLNYSQTFYLQTHVVNKS